MKRKEILKVCAKCGADDTKLNRMEGGYICDRCLRIGNEGRDATTKGMRAQKAAMTKQATANLYEHRGDTENAVNHQCEANEYGNNGDDLLQVNEEFVLASGEAVRANCPDRIVDTLKAPDVVTLDASAHRIELLSRMGNDCVALAVDAADSMKAGNSLEKMLAHQLAVAHKTALEITDKACFLADPVESARMFSVAARFMDTYQRGLLVFQRLRNGGEQKITIHHVNVERGGQAIVGNVRAGEEKEN